MLLPEDWAAQHGFIGVKSRVSDHREFLLRPGEADVEALDLAEPAFVLGLGDAGQQALADLGDPPPLGGIGSKEAAPQAAVLMGAAGAVGAAPQSPRAIRRRWKWPRNSCHSVSVGVRYSSPGRVARRRAMKARWPLMTSSV